jgi:hypothetical protein
VAKVAKVYFSFQTFHHHLWSSVVDFSPAALATLATLAMQVLG